MGSERSNVRTTETLCHHLLQWFHEPMLAFSGLRASLVQLGNRVHALRVTADYSNRERSVPAAMMHGLIVPAKSDCGQNV